MAGRDVDLRVEKVAEGPGSGLVIRSVGRGPGLVVLHGGGVGEYEYRRLARVWSDRFTVHLYNRRGRPGAPPTAADHTVEVDVADLAIVLERTGAQMVFGHSGGALVALRAALSLALVRVGVFDPGVSVGGAVPSDFIEPFAAAVAAGDHAQAIVLMGNGIQAGGSARRLPAAVQLLLVRAFLRTSIGRRFDALLPTVPLEVRQIAAHDEPASAYAGITAEVLLASGATSQPYFAGICADLAEALPKARALVLPGSHNAANVARPAFTRPFADFFSEGVASSAARADEFGERRRS